MKNRYWLVMILALLVPLSLRNPVSAAGPPEDDPDEGDDRRVGLMSTTVECLALKAGELDSASAIVHLEWDGQIEQAFLVLSAAGSRGGHSIYVNGQRVGSAPVRPGGSPCIADSPAMVFGSTDVIPIPARALTNGENLITLTNDADVGDGWTATNLHIEIHGTLSGPPVAALQATPSVSLQMSQDITSPILGSVWLTSTYELAQGREISQLVSYQIPDGYTGDNPVPLLIALHGMGGTGESARDWFAAEANNRGWLLAAPEMHGSHYINSGHYSLAWPGAQHDIIDAIAYMNAEYAVDPSRVYISGGSMGGQTAVMMAAKYPDVFAAAAAWKPITDLTDWYYEIDALGDPYNVLPRIRDETGGTTLAVPFEYQRRSPIEMPQNSRLIPIRMWHDVDDRYVPIHHSRDLKNAINGWEPVTPVILTEIGKKDNECPSDPYEHCYSPSQADVFDYLEGFILDPQPPLSLVIRTDESKPYYWLNVAQTAGDHWSEVDAAYSLTSRTVMATISDTQPLTLAFNLGSTPITDSAGIGRSGMGLPATTYLVNGGGNYKLENYTSGYLTTTLTTTGQSALTISAITVGVSAEPSVVAANPTATSTIQVVVLDHLENLAPDGTTVEFSTTEGAFSNGLSTYITTITAGQATTVLSLGPAADLAVITAIVESVTSTTSVDVIHPSIRMSITSDPVIIHHGQIVTYTYHLTNTGDVPLTGVTVVDDNGTPGDSGDDLTVCTNTSLGSGATASCSRSATLTQTTVSIATVTGEDPLDHTVTDSDSVTVSVMPWTLYLPIVIVTGIP